MEKTFKLPNLGENISQAEVLRVMVAVGDQVVKDQPVIEISSDKATIEVPAEADGIVKNIQIKVGDLLKENDLVYTFTAAEANEKTVAPAKEEIRLPEIKVQEYDTEKKVISQEFRLPSLGENIHQAEVLRVMVAEGEMVTIDQPVVEISSDKATIEVPSSVSGKIKSLQVKAGALVKENDLLFTLEAMAESKNEKAPAVLSPVMTEPVKTETPVKTEKLPEIKINKGQKIAPAAPSIRRFARELGIEINEVPGTGKNGRISIEDVKAYSKDFHKKIKEKTFVGIAAPSLPDFSRWGTVEKENMNNIRIKTAQNMSFAWNAVPHVTHFEKADISELEKLRKKYAGKAEAAGGKLTITAILTKLLASALKVFPKFAASIDLEKKEIIYKKYCHIGIAVDTERGLLVPVIRDADKKNIIEIAADLNKIAQKARERKIMPEDLQGGVFTISNLGGIGGIGFTPIVNYPEVAILGVSKSSFEPVFNSESRNFEPKLLMPLSLSYDHRIIDGADAARFMAWLKEAIENPLLLLIEG